MLMGHAHLTPPAVALSLFIACGAQTANRASIISSRTRPAPLAVVLTTDCGVEIDDQWALTHILLSPELQLRAIVTTHASSVHLSSATSARQAADVVARVGAAQPESVPVFAGADVPLQNVNTPRDSVGLDSLLSLSRHFSDAQRLIVLSIGAATDVASAIVKDPSIADRIALVAMGFRDWPDGGDEFNIKNDPLAWQVILNSHVPLVVGSSTATKRSLRLTRPEAARVTRSHGALGEYLYALFDQWLAGNSALAAQMVSPGAWVIWDEVVVAYVLGLARGEGVARPRLQADFFFSHPKTTERITWITRIDADQLWRDFGRKMDGRARAPTPRSH
jgi:purine nucleosidase